ncbi:SET domain [Carpediemonas membranifera]|uniref:SET domain n=1 Tax=Carpediemonas membranifera TaxID=201153 RepID=A0A8J6EBJ5_9EUKA|nr:SET domain [Carpediemonas membranifera]|eukprot:KAG9397360.1 SET domain [Carpediemonas membranifera]
MARRKALPPKPQPGGIRIPITSTAGKTPPSAPSNDSQEDSSSEDSIIESVVHTQALHPDLVAAIYPNTPEESIRELKEAEKDLPPLEPPSWLSTRLTHPSIAVEVQPCLAPDHTDVGRGLIATAAIEPGKLLGIYAGRIVSDEDYHANNSNMVFVHCSLCLYTAFHSTLATFTSTPAKVKALVYTSSTTVRVTPTASSPTVCSRTFQSLRLSRRTSFRPKSFFVSVTARSSLMRVRS